MANDALIDRIHHADIFDLCDQLEDASIDAIISDLPYGITAIKEWDTVIPFAPMWERFKRVIKPRGAIVLTASQPFTSALVMSNVAMFRYEWVWRKTDGGGFLNANRRPIPRHESVLIFYQREGIYDPQYAAGLPYRSRRGGAGIQVNNGGKTNVVGWTTISNGLRYPTSILEFPSETGYHPTQKPVALFSYLIRTYTQAGDVVFDPCCGSGTTAVAARAEKRHWICGDSSAEYVEIARKRLAEPYQTAVF